MKPLCIIEYSNRFQVQERVSHTLLYHGLQDSNDRFLEEVFVCSSSSDLIEIAKKFVDLEFVDSEGVKV